MTGASSSSPNKSAAAASPPPLSSLLVGLPVRRSEITAMEIPGVPRAPDMAASAERAEPPASPAHVSWGKSRAAWIAVALVLSKYAGFAVANHMDDGVTVLPRRALRAASTPIVVVSSSYPATERWPLPPPAPITAVIFARSSR